MQVRLVLQAVGRGRACQQSKNESEAAHAGDALNPAQVASGVNNGCKLLWRCAQGELHHVLTATNRYRALQVLRLSSCEVLEFLFQLLDASLATFHGIQESLL